MIIPQPTSLVQQPKPFDDRDWVYEIKHAGMRSAAGRDDPYALAAEQTPATKMDVTLEDFYIRQQKEEDL
jgi:hypothetical protein